MPVIEPRIPNPSKWPMVVLIVVIALLVISNSLTIHFLINQKPKVVVIDPMEGALVIEDKEVEPVLDQPEEAIAVEIKKDLMAGEVAVEWLEFPKSVYTDNLLDYQQLKGNFSTVNEKLKEAVSSIVLAGTAQSTPYENSAVYLIEETQEGMALHGNYLWVIKEPETSKLIVLGKYSDGGGWPILQELFVFNDQLTFKNWETSKTIAVPNSKYELVKSEMGYTKMLSSYDLIKQFKFNDDEYVYWDKMSGCFVIRRPGNTAQEYYINIDFLAGNRTSGYNTEAMSQVIDFTWSDGSKNEIEYQTTSLTGCGTNGCYSYPENINTKELIVVGKTKNDGNIYAYKIDLAEKSLSKEHRLSLTYEHYYPGYNNETNGALEKKPFKEFVEDYPLLYWQDPFGRWMEFLNIKYQPAVECGKPVIYLYPEEDMNVNVKVEPNGGIRLSEPSYGRGWSVFASTKSELYNFSDRQTYPYLFWEGFGYDYSQSDKGYVVTEREVEPFLKYILAELGLNEKETAHFNKFWVPKIKEQKKPYYFITFLPKNEFDKIAPLTVEPKPDTVIRVFMDYQGLDQFKNVEPLRIVTPERKGFTVVEWGGALHD